MNKVSDVFLAHAATDSPLAREVANACRAEGLEVFTTAELSLGVDVGDAVWDALAECRALIVLLSPSEVTSSMWIEIGAAQAWNKPIFVIVTDPSMVRLPPALTGFPLYSPGRTEEVVRAIKQSGQQLSDEDRSLLARLYAEIDESVDELVLKPGPLNGLVKRFRSRSGKKVSGESLLSELLRMRKQGVLTKKRGPSRPKRHSETT
ncbi:MAG: toll/interleukin-1 receptor domain-containing protein [Planctomycetes bacterium]|nr:toll/interleukin-1 receptor domain-containing protein [Planctomycetota bacterium]